MAGELVLQFATVQRKFKKSWKVFLQGAPFWLLFQALYRGVKYACTKERINLMKTMFYSSMIVNSTTNPRITGQWLPALIDERRRYEGTTQLHEIWVGVDGGFFRPAKVNWNVDNRRVIDEYSAQDFPTLEEGGRRNGMHC